MVMLSVVGAALAAVSPTPVTVEIVASGHVETPAAAYRVSGSVLVCAATQAEADRLFAQKTTAIGRSIAAVGATKANMTGASEKMSLTGLVGGLMSLSASGNCNKPAFPGIAGGTKSDSAAASKDAETDAAKVGATASLAFDAPDRATAARVIAALKAADAKPSDLVTPVLIDDAGPRRAAKQQALIKARVEADAYGGPLGLGRVTLAAISERQDIGSVDYIGQMLRSFGLPTTAATDVVATDVTLTVTFRLER